MHRNLHYLLFFVLTIIIVYLTISYNGTIDDGDSITHYLYSKWAISKPYLLIDHWNKPIFSILSVVFAQFGFIGLKIFNSILFLLSIAVIYRFSLNLKIKNSYLIIFLVGFMPQYILASQSGLTEILFSFLLILSLYLIEIEWLILASLLISFLPFSRPEGYFFILIYTLYLIYKKRLKYIPILFFGHIFFSIIGHFIFGEDYLWVFGKNPNVELNMTYGQTGVLKHYIKGLLSILGRPMYYLFWLGIIVYIYQSIRFKLYSISIFLAFLMIFCTIGAHTIFWYFGLFKSFGLLRNLLTIAPLCGIFILIGFNFFGDLCEQFKIKSIYFQFIFCLTIIIYTFSSSKYTFQYPKAFQLNNTQILSLDLNKYIVDSFPNRKLIYHYYPYLSVLQNENVFEPTIHRNISVELINDSIPNNTIIIWDDWYAVMEGRLSLESLKNDKRLVFKKSFSTIDESNKKRSFYVFYKP